MCLSQVDRMIPESSPEYAEERFAWKAFLNWTGGLFVPFYSDRHSKGFPTGQWIQAVRERVSTIPAYDSGFHAFTSEEDCRSAFYSGYDIRKVKLRGVHTEGKEFWPDGRVPVVVADEMFILEEETNG